MENCLIIGGFCTSIQEDICDALHKSFQMGTRSRAVEKANYDAISREYLEEQYWQALIPKEMVNTDVELGINIGIEKMHNIIKGSAERSAEQSRADGVWMPRFYQGVDELLYECSNCHTLHVIANYCPNCGAKMKG